MSIDNYIVQLESIITSSPIVSSYNITIDRKTGVIFRYDNSPDPRAKKLETFPYHKHLKNLEIVQSQEISLKEILKEIEGTYFMMEE